VRVITSRSWPSPVWWTDLGRGGGLVHIPLGTTQGSGLRGYSDRAGDQLANEHGWVCFRTTGWASTGPGKLVFLAIPTNTSHWFGRLRSPREVLVATPGKSSRWLESPRSPAGPTFSPVSVLVHSGHWRGSAEWSGAVRGRAREKLHRPFVCLHGYAGWF
jgi:hypothetical protein